MVISIKEQNLTDEVLNNQKANYDSNYDSSVLGNTFTFPRCQRISYFYWKNMIEPGVYLDICSRNWFKVSWALKIGFGGNSLGFVFLEEGTGHFTFLMQDQSFHWTVCQSHLNICNFIGFFSLSGPRHLIGFNFRLWHWTRWKWPFLLLGSSGLSFFSKLFSCSI